MNVVFFFLLYIATMEKSTSTQPATKRAPRCGLVLVTLIAVLLLLARTDPLMVCDRFASPPSQRVEPPVTPTDAEAACLYGDASRSNKTAVPNVVHFLYIPTSGAFSFVNYLSVRSALVTLSPAAVFIHYSYVMDPLSDRFDDPYANSWLRLLKPHVHLVHHPALERTGGQDALRLQIMRELGGVYMELDTLALRPFTGLMNPPMGQDVVLGSEGEERDVLSAGVIVTRPQSAFISGLLRRYEEGEMLSLRELDEVLPGRVCEVAPGAFYWPTWNTGHVAWMHERLDEDAARLCNEEVEENGGALFDGQVAYRAWGDAAKRQLARLTPDVVRDVDSRFNILARRFLE